VYHFGLQGFKLKKFNIIVITVVGEWGPMGPGGPMMRGRPPVGPMRPRFAHPAMAGPPRGECY
jgi:hypothetical protein